MFLFSISIEVVQEIGSGFVLGILNPMLEHVLSKLTHSCNSRWDIPNHGPVSLKDFCGTILDAFGLLITQHRDSWRFSKTNITEKFTAEDYRKNIEEGEEPLAVLKPDRRLLFFATDARPVIEDGDVVISYVRADTPEERKADRAAKDSEKNGEKGDGS